jgi:hypothetical protein
MHRTLLAPLLLTGVAATTVGIAATAGSADAAACGTPHVSVSSSRVTSGTSVTFSGTGFDCFGSFVNPVWINERVGQNANGPTLKLSNGSFSFSDKVSGNVGDLIDLKVNATKTFARLVTIIAPSSGSTTLGGSVPTAVPAGHVDVAAARSNQSGDSAVGVLAGAGVVLLVGGTTVGVRRRARADQVA